MSIRRVVPDISSKDINASREFYTDLLGLTVAMDMGKSGTYMNSPAFHDAATTKERLGKIDQTAVKRRPVLTGW